jgi:hypothetical protein
LTPDRVRYDQRVHAKHTEQKESRYEVVAEGASLQQVKRHLQQIPIWPRDHGPSPEEGPNAEEDEKRCENPYER